MNIARNIVTDAAVSYRLTALPEGAIRRHPPELLTAPENMAQLVVLSGTAERGRKCR